MLHIAFPNEVGDMYKAFHLIGKLHECAEVGETGDDALDTRAFGKLFLGFEPRIFNQLLETERKAPPP